MGVSFYTVRIVLEVLGIVDYGIYNVVGGVVSAFGFISNTMASASERFFAFEIGRNNFTRLKQLFSLTLTIYAVMAFIILLLAETVGLWFINTQLIIPPARLIAAHYIYQFAVISFMFTLLTIPYNSVIIAREQMSVYAYVSIVEVTLRLAILYILIPFHADRLKLYAVLTFAVTLIITFIYRTYCKRKFEECTFRFYWERGLFNALLSYSGWNLFGTLTVVSFNQGINFLLNIFFGPVINTASAIAYQVNNGVMSFSSNFYTAVRPQIVKSYAEGNARDTINLVYKSTKFSFFLLLLVSMPILLETNFILKLWLKEIPPFTGLFVKLIIMYSFVNLLQIPISTAVQATGNIRKYQVIVGLIMLLCLPGLYVCLKFGLPPQFAYYSMILVSCIAIIFRLAILRQLIPFSYISYIKQVLFKILIVCSSACITPSIVMFNMAEGWPRFLMVSLLATLSSICSIYFLGLTRDEKKFILNMVKRYLI